MRATAAAIAFTVLLAFPALATPSIGFRVAGASTAKPPRVVCATNLPFGLPGLYCASPVISRYAYDGRGIVRLAPSGRAAIVRSGNDLLLAIDVNADHSTRPLLTSGSTWSASGYRCASRDGEVTCRRGRHGFTITSRLKTY
jgi:hypothetical protein